MQSRLNQITLILSNTLYAEYIEMHFDYFKRINGGPLTLDVHPLFSHEFERLNPTRVQELTRNPAKGYICRSWLISADGYASVRPGLYCDTEKVISLAVKLRDFIHESRKLS